MRRKSRDEYAPQGDAGEEHGEFKDGFWRKPSPTQGNAIEGLVKWLRGDTQMSDRPWAVELMLEAATALETMDKALETQMGAASVLVERLLAAQERITRLTGALEKIAANERGIDNDSIARAALAREA